MLSIALLLVVTCAFTAYNLLIKQSSFHAEVAGASTITATITLQLAALATSLLFLLLLRLSGEQSFLLPTHAYRWAVAAGFCIGIAEVAYFYLFAGVAGQPPMPVSIAVPVVVGGTVVLATLAAWLLFGEELGARQWCGAVVVAAGLALLSWH